MVNYLKFSEVVKARGVPRFTFICGPDLFLVERSLDLCKKAFPVDSLFNEYLVAGDNTEQEIWDALNEYPANPGLDKFIVIRDAQKIKSWEPFLSWIRSRYIPQIRAVFISTENDWSASDARAAVVKSAQALYVRCLPLSETDAVTLLQSLGKIEVSAAKHLLVRVGNDIGKAVDFTNKMAYFNTYITAPLINKMVPFSPADSFITELTELRKGKALAAIKDIPENQATYRYVVDMLTKRLGDLILLHKYMPQYLPMGKLVELMRKPVASLTPLMGAARHYDKIRVRQCVEALAFVDGRLSQPGLDTGILEVLVGLW